ncbi:recQ [Mytilus coruscus]|uniref:RecQ n=1 Tax=Mytilus coruscus TaxID=42192 RepID=A0A6J8C4X6_MYTCO|nr:recQ [Mytilus coruscus]
MATSIENIQLNFELKEHQKSAIAYLLEGNDVFVVLPTGYGKTVIYSIHPELFRMVKKIDNSVVLVVSPLVALMRDQKEQFLKQGIESVYLGEKLDKEICKKVCDGLIPILLMSPESLFSGVWRETLSLPVYQKCLSAVVIDEAHCVEEWGKEFRKDYSRLGELRSILPNAVMLALTATATKQSRKEIASYLQMQD